MRSTPALLAALLLALLLAPCPPAWAGGGPERTVVVVNADSPVSLQVAHAYALSRGIPPSHLIYLEGVPTLKVVDLATFRERLWKPVKQALVARGLLEHTDVLAWSADFPFGVDVAAEAQAKKVGALPNVPFRAALTGLTYLWRHVEAEEPARYLDLDANRYFQRDGTTAARAGRPLSESEAVHARTAQAAIQKKEYAAARDAYLELLKSAPDLMGAWYDLACCHARLGDLDEALKALEKAVERGWSDAMHTLGDPDLEAVRRRPEFDALLERMHKTGKVTLVSRGFRADRAWNRDGSRAGPLATGEEPRDLYLLGVMLGYTGEWGNSAPEVLDCLARGAASDGTQPKGTVYLLANDDVRADTRERFFPGAVEALEALGRKAVVLTKGQDGQDGNVPKGKHDIVGAMLGIAGFAWPGNDSVLLPGALVEHLTSFGADFSHGGQTKLSELIRAGSAGSSGTVAEPLALWQKFPVPALHVHYARGCSMAEAYYQSMAGPWQTLLVGDPLARPFAAFAKVEIAAPLADAPLSGTQQVRVTVTDPPAQPGVLLPHAPQLELWVDGRFIASGARDEALAWDTTKEADGVHELRVVSVDGSDVETRSQVVRQVTVANAGRAVTLTGPKERPRWGERLALTGKVAGATEVDLLLGERVLATAPVKAGAFKLEVDTLRLGPGAVPLVARARFADGPAALSAALLTGPDTGGAAAKPGPTKPPGKPKKPKDAKAAPAGAKGGLKLVATDEKKKTHEGVLPALTDEALAKALADLKLAAPTSLTLEGEIQVPADGLYQLILTSAGALEVQWAGQRALEVAAAQPDRLAFAAALLKTGWTPIRLTLTPQGTPRLAALLGGQVVTAPIAPAALRH